VRLDCLGALPLNQARCLGNLPEYVAQSSMSTERYVGIRVTKVTNQGFHLLVDVKAGRLERSPHAVRSEEGGKGVGLWLLGIRQCGGHFLVGGRRDKFPWLASLEQCAEESGFRQASEPGVGLVLGWADRPFGLVGQP